MAHTDTWNAAYELVPAGTDYYNTLDTVVTEFKRAIRERMALDHYWDPAGTNDDHGLHQKITFHSQVAKPTNVANRGFLYIKDVSAKVELFWEDEDGNELQLTNAGGFNIASEFPAGTKMVFYQDTAPAGWTIQNTLDDKLLFITKGSAAGGQTGGGEHSTGVWTQPGHNHTLSAHTHGMSHTHSVNLPPNLVLAAGAYSTPAAGTIVSGVSSIIVTGVPSNDQTNAAATSNTWRPAAYCAIIAEKA